MKSFEIFSQPDGPVGKLNQPVHWVQFTGTAVWLLCFVYVGFWSFRVRITLHLSCWILDSMRKVLKIFEIFSQSDEPIGKPYQPVHWVQFVETAVWVLCFVCIGSWSFEFKIALRLSFWIPDFVRKVLKNFEIFSQSTGSVGKSNQPVHWVQFAGTTVWVLCFVCIGSWSF